MNRDDTTRYYSWMSLRHQCKRLMMICLVLASVWALLPLGVPVMANGAALSAVCKSTAGCETARLCSGWRVSGKKDTTPPADEVHDWRPEIDVCMKGQFVQRDEELIPGTTKAWVPALIRPLLSNRNRVWWRKPS